MNDQELESSVWPAAQSYGVSTDEARHSEKKQQKVTLQWQFVASESTETERGF
jgi:hypothetical protein